MLYHNIAKVCFATKQSSLNRFSPLTIRKLTNMAETNILLSPKKPAPPPNPDLETLATTLIKNGPHKVESTPRRVRALFGGQFIFDTTSAKHVWEHKYFPQFWVPISSVVPGILSKGSTIDGDETASAGILDVKGKTTERVLIFHKGPLEGLVRFEFKAMGKHITASRDGRC